MPVPTSREENQNTPSYRQLRIIESIAAHRSIGKAAQALHMSQPAVTRALQTVEDLLGVKLFDRTPNGVVPTVFAEPVLKRTQSIHAAMQATKQDLKYLNAHDTHGLIIGGGPYSSEIFAYPAAARMKIADPNINITVTPSPLIDLVAHLHSAAIDLAVCETGLIENQDDLLIDEVAVLPVVFACRPEHPLARSTYITFKDVVSYPLAGNVISPRITAELGSDIGRLGHIDQKTGALMPSISVMTPSAIKHAVAASDAVALMPEAYLQGDVAAGRVMAMPRTLAPRLAARMGIVTHRARPATPLVERFRHEVHAVANALPAM